MNVSFATDADGNGCREVSKQLQRRPIKRAVRNVMIVTKARDNHRNVDKGIGRMASQHTALWLGPGRQCLR
jgi:hypothetical protein